MSKIILMASDYLRTLKKHAIRNTVKLGYNELGC